MVSQQRVLPLLLELFQLLQVDVDEVLPFLVRDCVADRARLKTKKTKINEKFSKWRNLFLKPSLFCSSFFIVHVYDCKKLPVRLPEDLDGCRNKMKNGIKINT